MTLTDFLKKIGNLNRANAPMAAACLIQSLFCLGTYTYSLDNDLVALSPNLHRSFDAGLISLTDDYHVLVKPGLKEAETDYPLKKLEGRRIRLPKEEWFWPGLGWVTWQRER